jgi:salicylate hydroxylase
MSSRGYQILILGGGVAGLTTALALTKFASTSLCPTITIFEIRSKPGTVGGAINLTPNALRLLDYLGVLPIVKQRRYGIIVNAVEVFSIYHPRKLAESSFRGPKNEGIGDPPYKVR